MTAPLLLRADLAEIRQHAEAAYPKEACGFVLRRDAASLVRRCRNVSPTPETHYAVHPKDLVDIARLRARGWAVHAIYHSHTRVDEDATFSPDDVKGAMGPDGEPTFPTAGQVVVSLRGGRAHAAGGYVWDATRRRFIVVGAAILRGRLVRQVAVMPLVAHEDVRLAPTAVPLEAVR